MAVKKISRETSFTTSEAGQPQRRHKVTVTGTDASTLADAALAELPTLPAGWSREIGDVTTSKGRVAVDCLDSLVWAPTGQQEAV